MNASVAGAAACIALAFAPRLAAANGRCKATVSVRSRPDDTQRILVPATFGLLSSSDGGGSFQWICEDAVGYGGTYDPDYAIARDGTIYATTFEGLRASRDDGCTYEDTAFYTEPPTDAPTTAALECIQAECTDRNDDCTPNRDTVCGCQWIGEVEVASDDSVWAATSTGGAMNDLYRSTDGQRFFAMGLATDRIWWKTLRTAPSDPQRIYVSGFEPSVDPDAVLDPDDECRPKNGPIEPLPAKAVLRRSVDGGATWEQLSTGDFDFGTGQPNLAVAAVSPTDPDLVFARVIAANPPSGDKAPFGDALYRSTDGGETWTRSLDFADVISGIVVRADGQTVVVGSAATCPGEGPALPKDDDCDLPGDPALIKGCVRISRDAGETWEVPAQQPRLGCLGERSDGTLFACGANWEPDEFAVATSTDGETWDPILRFSEIEGPLDCPVGTEQHECAALTWPPLCDELGVCVSDEEEDAGPGDGGDSDTCSGCGAGGAAGWAAALLALAATSRLRRRRPRSV